MLSGAKHLLLFERFGKEQILRSAQHDKRMDYTNSENAVEADNP